MHDFVPNDGALLLLSDMDEVGSAWPDGTWSEFSRIVR
uniref:Uncharacterized protein n=1 Tax=Aegilops tauschii subsp. strangulata TaxID=200361 RepID=A0A452ZBG0_AEGTS